MSWGSRWWRDPLDDLSHHLPKEGLHHAYGCQLLSLAWLWILGTCDWVSTAHCTVIDFFFTCLLRYLILSSSAEGSESRIGFDNRNSFCESSIKRDGSEKEFFFRERSLFVSLRYSEIDSFAQPILLFIMTTAQRYKKWLLSKKYFYRVSKDFTLIDSSPLCKTGSIDNYLHKCQMGHFITKT